ncbi:MAG: alanine racemase [Porticoccus sp.]|jgi:alanine racemase
MARPAQAIIDLAALRHNYALAQRLAGSGKVLAVVKANAYGHGIVKVAEVLESLAPALGVACIEEAIQLRNAGIKIPILLMEGAFTFDEIVVASEQGFWLMLTNQQQLTQLLTAKITRPINIWLKIDTGMHRLGIEPAETADFYQQLVGCKNVREVVIATHFASADDLDSKFTDQQLSVFNQATNGIGAPASLANSAGLLGWPAARRDWSRPGFMLYGNTPFAKAHVEADKLQHVMTLKSAVIAVCDVPAGDSVGYANTWVAQRVSRIATVAIGYGDGYPRQAPNGTPVLINGQRVELAGRVSMDMISIDVTDIENVQIGDEVILWGEALSTNEVASYLGTSGYEMMARMPDRVPRIYIN